MSVAWGPDEPRTRKPPMRIQIAVGHVLVAEAIVEADMLGSAFTCGGGLWERFVMAKHRAGKPAGGAVSGRADLPRVWNVPVGNRIRAEDWRDDPEEQAQFEAEAERRCWTTPVLNAKKSA